MTKPQAGHLAKAGVEAGEIIREFRIAADVASDYQPGATIEVGSVFQVGQKVDVQGTSIGKGFRWHDQAAQLPLPARIARQQPLAQRAGSISMAQDPGRVFPGKKMSGHMGDDTITTQNLDIVRVDDARQLLLIRGAVPGFQGRLRHRAPAVKSNIDAAAAKGAN